MNDSLKCPHCGADVRPGGNFCSSCGQKIGHGKVAVTPNDAVRMSANAPQSADSKDFTKILPEMEAAQSLASRDTTRILPGAEMPTELNPEPRRKPSRAWLWIVVALLIAALCGVAVYFFKDRTYSSYDDDDSDSRSGRREQADSAKTDVVEEVAEVQASATQHTAAQQNAEYESPETIKYRKNFTSKDMSLCDLHGRVSYARLYEDGRQKEHYDFSAEGNLTTASGTHNSNSVLRDEAGYVISESSPDGSIYYVWNHGLLASSSHPTQGQKRYIYSDKGELRGIEYSDGYTTRTESYTEYAYDPYLNWIRRTRVTPDGIRYTQTRAITYF